VEVADPVAWAAKTQADFASYRAIILGDATCSGLDIYAAAEANKATWSAAINGNIILIGADPGFHANNTPTVPATTLMSNSIAFAGDVSGKTGLYAAFGCAYYTAPPTGVPISFLSELGAFTGAGNSWDAVHMVASHPALAGLTDELLSNWSQSTHMGFVSFPEDYVSLASQNGLTGPGQITFGDGTTGIPYIIVKGAGVIVIGGPVITDISPNSGPVAGGTTVIITGTDLTDGTVTFGGAAASCTVDSSTQITCTTPPHAAGAVDVVVTTPVGPYTASDGFTYVADPIPAPTITGLAPTSGPVAGGTTVVITGTNLTGGTVTFGGSAATCTVNSATQITCTTPPHAAGAVNVVVTTPGGSATSTGGFTYVAVPTPTITSIVPNSGPVAGGTSVVITGTNLTGGTVTFGGLSATCTVDSPTQITCTTPAHAAGAVNVVVTTPGGSATSTGGFTYVAAPPTTLPPVSFNVCPPDFRAYTSGNIVVPPAAGTGYTDVDVVFAVDTTGSMGGQIASAKAGAIDIMNGVKATFPGAQFAVIEYKDYPPQDNLPFFIHQVLTTDNSLVATALNGLSASGGGDTPESAGAAFIAAQGLAWRGGTVGKFIVLITDAEAQPVDVASGKSIDTILGELNTADITLLVVASGAQTYWETKAALTGDNAAVIAYAADTFDEDVVDLIIGAASRTLNWTLSNPAYNSWVSSVPTSYSIGASGDTYTFAVTVTVPVSATGSHTFTINYALDGDVIATELVTVTIACAPLPDDWSGTAEVISNQPIVTVGRPHIGNPQQISAYAGFGQGANTAYLPMLFKKAFGGGSYNSAFYVQNASVNTAAFSITYYNLDGSVACTVNDSLAQGSSKGYWVPAETCLPDGWVGGAVIASNNPIAVVGRPHVGSEVMSYNALQTNGATAHLPMLFRAAFSGTYNAAIYIQNTSNAAATFSMSFYSEAGALTCTMTGQTIPAHGIKNYWLPTQTCVPAGWSGGVTITSDQNIVALARIHVGAQISTYAGFNAAGSQAYVPMVFRRAFADNYTSALYIQNVTNSPATVTISYRKNDGTETCSETLNLAARAAGRLWTPTQTCIPDGWAGGALVTSTQNVVAVGRSHVMSTGEVAAYPGHIAAFNQAFLPMLFKTAFGNYESAMYVQNVSASPADISIIFRDASGVVGCTVTETLPAYATKGYWLPNVCKP
jgi:hypothetical protein